PGGGSTPAAGISKRAERALRQEVLGAAENHHRSAKANQDPANQARFANQRSLTQRSQDSGLLRWPRWHSRDCLSLPGRDGILSQANPPARIPAPDLIPRQLRSTQRPPPLLLHRRSLPARAPHSALRSPTPRPRG